MTQLIIDVDTHLTEPPDVWTTRVPSKWIDVTTGFSITRNVTAIPSGRSLITGGAWSAKKPRSVIARRSC